MVVAKPLSGVCSVPLRAVCVRWALTSSHRNDLLGTRVPVVLPKSKVKLMNEGDLKADVLENAG